MTPTNIFIQNMFDICRAKYRANVVLGRGLVKNSERLIGGGVVKILGVYGGESEIPGDSGSVKP